MSSTMSTRPELDSGVPAVAALAPERPQGSADAPTVLATVITCAIAALGFAGTVSLFGMGAFVIPGVAVGAVAALVGRGSGRWWWGAGVGSIIALGWAEVVNLVGGDLNGPIARSTFTAGVAAAFAVTLIRSAAPTMFLVPVTGIIFGAVVLGAAGEVVLIAGATACACVITLGMSEYRRRRWLVPSHRRWSTLAMLVGLLVVAAVVATVMPVVRGGESVIYSSSDVNQSISPPWQSSSPTPTASASPTPTPTASASPTPTPTASASPTPTPTASPPPTSDSTSELLRTLLLWVLILLLVVAALVIAYLVWRRWKRARYRARLRSGSSRDRVAGAWVWARQRLGGRGLQFDPSVSPDLLPGAELPETLRPDAAEHLGLLAQSTAEGAFGEAEPSEDLVERAWADADWLVANVRRARGSVRPRHR